MASSKIASLEAQVLSEYAAVATNLDQVRLVSPRRLPSPFLSTDHPSHKQMAIAIQKLSAVQPHLLNQVRPLERKLGLVLTLFKGPFLRRVFWGQLPRLLTRVSFSRAASVWALLVQREENQDEGYR
jgi:hypothetical protein